MHVIMNKMKPLINQSIGQSIHQSKNLLEA